MKTKLIDNNNGSPIAYNSLLLPPKSLSIFGSDLCLKIISELVKEPACAMDMARNLEEHEQKIYYHLRKLEAAGIIHQVRSEKRYGMTAKIFSLVSPVVATKLYDDGHPVKAQAQMKNPDVEKFLHPFIENGKFNAKIIIGWPYPHGKYDYSGLDGGYAIDLALFLGNFLNELKFPHYKVDTKISEEDLKGNLILIGNPKTNSIIDRINSNIPIFFDEKKEWSVFSKITKRTYRDDRTGIILKFDNPFNKNKKILLLGGKRTRGTVASIIAFTRYINEVIKGNASDRSITAKVFVGMDKDGDELLDAVKFLE